jgi:hypothetical protein
MKTKNQKKKLELNKELVTVLNKKQQTKIVGGGGGVGTVGGGQDPIDVKIGG